MRDRPDFYVILGVEPSASLTEIQAAYRERIQVIHPDRFDRVRTPEAWAHANRMLRELIEAYRTLSVPRLRNEYDRLYTGPQIPSPKPDAGSTQPPRRTEQRPVPKKRTGSRVPMFATLASIAALVLWAVFQDRAEKRDADALFLSPAPGSRQGSPDIEALVKEYGGTIVPRAEASKPTGPLSVVQFSPDKEEPRSLTAPLAESSGTVAHQSVDRDDSSLRGCEPGTTAHVLPENGSLWRHDRSVPLAPLEVRVKGSANYLVKLEREGVTAAMMLVRAASTAEISLPLGDYVLKYAAGSGEYWCGESSRFPFGRQTSFHKADELFSFRKESDHYSGYTVELFLQANGNLNTTALAPKAW